MTERELFLVLLSTQPMPLDADAAVVLCGEDSGPRVQVGMELMVHGLVSRVLFSGGRDELPRWHGAKRIRDEVIGKGADPRRILTETESTNTHEQAVNVVGIMRQEGWDRVVLAVSAYHQYRAFLAFLRQLHLAGLERDVLLVSRPATVAPWLGKPAGCKATRLDLLKGELAKVATYRRRGHLCSYSDAIAYLKAWEGVEA